MVSVAGSPRAPAGRRFPTVSAGGRAADGVVGFGGGVLGGVAGLSGALLTIWCGLRGWSADTQRGGYQPFNLAILGIVLGAYAVQGMLTAQVGRYLLICVPGTSSVPSWASGSTGGWTSDSSARSSCGSCTHRASC